MAIPVNSPGSRMAFGVNRDEAGNWWVMITHLDGTTQYTWAVPVDSAVAMADQFRDNIVKTVEETRAERGGLVLASSTPTFNRSQEASRRHRRG